MLGLRSSKLDLSLQCTESLAVLRAPVVTAGGLSCFEASGTLVSGPGIEPTSSELKGGFSTTRPPGSPNVALLLHRPPSLDLKDAFMLDVPQYGKNLLRTFGLFIVFLIVANEAEMNTLVQVSFCFPKNASEKQIPFWK